MSSDEFLGALDPESPHAPAAQIANHLRAAILTKKLRAGETLPSNKDLRDRYGVARETIKRAMEILDRERLVITQQGKSPRVRAMTQRAVELRPHLEEAFRADHVSIDFAGFSSETLGDSLAEILDKIRMGTYSPETIKVRILIPDMKVDLALPRAVDPEVDNKPVLNRMARITARVTARVTDEVDELYDLGLVKAASVQIRQHRLPPVFKLYIINRSEAFFGFYPIVQRSISLRGEELEIFDPMGKNADLLHYALSDEESTQDSQFIDTAQAWFNSIWETVSYDAATED